MKLKLILSITLLLLTTLLSAQLLSEEAAPEVNTEFENHLSLIIGVDLVLGVPLGNDIKAGIGYRTQDVNYSAIVEYINVVYLSFLPGGKETKYAIIHPEIRLGLQLTKKLEMFTFAGIGFANIEVGGQEIIDPEIITKNETLTSFGFGIKYWHFVLIYRIFQSSKHQLALGVELDVNFKYLSSKK